MKKIYNNKKPVYNAEYRRRQYIKHREKILKKQKEYDDQHREEINRKARARYRAKCGIKPIKEAAEKPPKPIKITCTEIQLKRASQLYYARSAGFNIGYADYQRFYLVS